MAEELYERYKDVLRRGHVAALRGRYEIAAAAYDEASRIAPERALPYTSLGDVLRRLDRFDEALTAFGAALERSPNDETALAARSDVLATLGRRAEAAADLDALAETQEAAGRLADACDSARHALELAESRGRRRHVEDLARRLREAAPQDAVAAAALERALTILEAPVGPGAGRGFPATVGEPPGEPAEAEQAAPPGERAAPPGGPTEAAGPEAPVAPEPEPPPPDRGAELTTEAEELIAARNRDAALERCLEAMAAHRAAGRLAAAIDAGYLALAVSPGDPDLHLALAELYLDQGWREPAAEKLLLLGRLVGLDGDDTARDRVCALAKARLADDARLAELCA